MTASDYEHEAELVRRAIGGDREAFGQLVLAYQTPVYNLAYRMLGNAVEAEDAAQETFLRVYQHLHSYDPQRPFRSWLFSIASHYCIDRLRRRRITWLSFEDEIAAPLVSPTPHPETVMARQEEAERVQSLLMHLSPTDRAAIVLRYWYDCSYEEIAAALDLTIGAVKSRLHRARRALGRMLTEGENGDEM
ncbi:MAG TPA: sigma-70 family RNA polymerase sigma factor [Anaerolineae bacterium]|nr:sigma-70 family RNA polymerase sigma factor [Anaerolineae bacterium]